MTAVGLLVKQVFRAGSCTYRGSALPKRSTVIRLCKSIANLLRIRHLAA